jgi:hypothetical protein
MSRADYVFQTVALKEVPSFEFFPMKAVKTNEACLVAKSFRNNTQWSFLTQRCIRRVGSSLIS